MQNEILILIDLENVSFDYVIKKIKGIDGIYSAYAFCDFTSKNGNIITSYFYDYNIKPVQVFHQKNKKNSVDFVLLRYAYSQLFQNKKLKHIYLFSSDGDFADLCIFIRKQGIKLTVDSSQLVSLSLTQATEVVKEINCSDNTLNISNNIEYQLTNIQKINIVKEEYAKAMKLKIDKQTLVNNIKARIPNSNNQSLSKTFPFINKCNNFNDVLAYCKLSPFYIERAIILEVYNKNKYLSNRDLWVEIRREFGNGAMSISSIFPNKNIKTVQELKEYVLNGDFK